MNYNFIMKNFRRTKREVEAFLEQFKSKLDVWGIYFIERGKNDNTLSQLGITRAFREEVVRQIKVEDYVETICDDQTLGELWVFGKQVNGSEIYIKVALGRFGSRTICVSFHIAEYPMEYVFRNK